jgi:hypothetical protein
VIEEHKEYKRKDLLAIHMDALKRLSEMDLKNIKADASISFGEGTSYAINVLIFDQKLDNRSFTAYDWQKTDAIKRTMDRVLDVIELDDFAVVRGADFNVN